jgi:hypothetical protein
MNRLSFAIVSLALLLITVSAVQAADLCTGKKAGSITFSTFALTFAVI